MRHLHPLRPKTVSGRRSEYKHFRAAHRWHRQKERFLFRRFFRPLIAVVILMLAGFGLASLVLRQTPVLWVGWLVAGVFFVFLPASALFFIGSRFRKLSQPLADIMAAADAVAGGDFSVRVPEHFPGELGKLATSFNRMVQELARAEHQRKQLTADVAHELRTPLHILQGNLEGMMDGIYPMNSDQIELLLDETAILSHLVSDLQTLTLAENCQLPLNRETMAVQTLLEDIAGGFAVQADQAGLVLSVLPCEGVSLFIQADPDRIAQVLGNLIANAVRHTSPGGKIILSGSAESTQVVIEVEDTGEGIPPEDLPFVFDRFWRGDQARHHVRDTGSGLGLSIAREIVRLHDGEISVSSTLGQGTIFRVILPQANG